MKRLHVHISVESLNDSIGFYSTLFGVDPDVRESDYAKWMLDDPQVNFAISERCGRTPGIDHLGIQVDANAELAEISGRLSRANRPVVEQKGAKCCYAEGDKAWASDPQGVAWETFHTVGGIAVYGQDSVDRSKFTPIADESGGCCPKSA